MIFQSALKVNKEHLSQNGNREQLLLVSAQIKIITGVKTAEIKGNW